METILAGFAVAAVTGVTWVAWQQPHRFPRLHIFLFTLMALGLVLCQAYDEGLYAGRVLVAESLQKGGKIEELGAIFEANRLLTGRILLIWFGATVYLLALLLLPLFTHSAPEKSKDSSEKGMGDGGKS